MTSGTWVLAHQGGWDELGLVLTPILLFAGLLWLANRRATALAAHPDGDEDAGPDPGHPDPGS